MIGGTGRAGTSFLVHFLEACGLDTGATQVPFDARARAGLERNLLDEGAPYVVKDPWLFAYCDQIDQSQVEVEALLVPVRELAGAATSRILQERITMADSFWADLPPSDVHGMVPGGAVYSLDPLDEARILAVGFHRLILWATVRQIPLFLLEFPRIINDAEYLIDTLWPWLGAHCERDRAMSAFASVADPDLVRVDGARVSGSEGHMADAEQLDREAMRLLLKERDVILTATRDDLAATEQRLSEAERRLVDAEHRLDETQDRFAASERQVSETEQQLGSRLAQAEATLADLAITLAQTERALDAATTEIDAVHRTLSWRLTRPLRTLRTLGGAKRGGRDLAPEEVSSQPLDPSASGELRVETGDHESGQPAT